MSGTWACPLPPGNCPAVANDQLLSGHWHQLVLYGHIYLHLMPLCYTLFPPVKKSYSMFLQVLLLLLLLDSVNSEKGLQKRLTTG